MSQSIVLTESNYPQKGKKRWTLLDNSMINIETVGKGSKVIDLAQAKSIHYEESKAGIAVLLVSIGFLGDIITVRPEDIPVARELALYLRDAVGAKVVIKTHEPISSQFEYDKKPEIEYKSHIDAEGTVHLFTKDFPKTSLLSATQYWKITPSHIVISRKALILPYVEIPMTQVIVFRASINLLRVEAKGLEHPQHISFADGTEELVLAMRRLHTGFHERLAQPVQIQQTAAAPSTADQIREFKQLADEGIITQEEFELKRRALMGI